MEADVNAVLNCVKQQRNDGLDAVAMLNGVIAQKDKRIAELESALAAFTKQIERTQE